MKKIIIISIIVFCLLSFIEISCLANPNYGEFWASIDEESKMAYVAGVREGVQMCLLQLMDYSPPQSTNKEAVAKFATTLENNYNFISLFTKDEMEKTPNLLKTFTKVIDDLYKDPANTYIPIANMCTIASRKLRGEPINPLLGELRKKALP
mgnify:CR=1 FL=1